MSCCFVTGISPAAADAVTPTKPPVAAVTGEGPEPSAAGTVQVCCPAATHSPGGFPCTRCILENLPRFESLHLEVRPTVYVFQGGLLYEVTSRCWLPATSGQRSVFATLGVSHH